MEEKKSWYEFINEHNDIRSNVGFDYEGKIFENTLSNQILNGDTNRKLILESIEKVVHSLFETTKYIKNYINYTVKKDNKYVR
jgi:hypothetical protein